MVRKKERGPDPEEMRRSMAEWLGVGIEFCLVVGACTLGGYWLDTKTNSLPGFMIMGFLLGFAGMIYTMVKRAGGLKWK